MDLLVGSLDHDGELAYFKNGIKKWSMNLNCPKFIEFDGNNYYSFSQGDKVTLYSFKKDGDRFIVHSQFEIEDKTISHLFYNKSQNCLFCSCMDSGYFYIVEVKNGKFIKLIHKELLGGYIPSRCHEVLFNKQENFCAIVNLAQDTIYFYDFCNRKISLKYQMKFEKGIQPRHILFSEDEKILYLITEASCEIIVIDYVNQKIIQHLPLFKNQVEGSKGCTLQIDFEKKIMYTNLRIDDSISTFKINPDHTLTYSKTYSSFGKNARHMVLSKNGNYLALANINSDNVTLVDTTSFELVNTIHFTHAASILEVTN